MDAQAALKQRRAALLNEMGLAPVWRLRRPLPGQQAVADAKARDWEELHARVAACQACALGLQHRPARPVAGAGGHATHEAHVADWLVVGDAPETDEVQQGQVMSGPAGGLLTAMLAALGVCCNQEVYFTQVVKCPPPEHQPPSPQEMAACQPFLLRQIELLQPRLILALGKTVAQGLLPQDTPEPLSSLRGRLFQYHGVPLLVTHAPAWLLGHPEDKAQAWEDLCLAQNIVQADGAAVV